MEDPIDQLTSVLRQFDEMIESVDEDEVQSAIAQVCRALTDTGRELPPQCIAESAAFMFCPEYDWKGNGWRSYYGPMFAGVRKDGELVYTPDVKQFDATTFAYWEKRAKEARHPVLKVRYADLCWDFQKQITGKAPHIDMARIVIDSAADATSRRLVKHEVDGFTKLTRALAISLALGDGRRVEVVRDAIISYEDAVARDDAPGLWGLSYDLILDNAKVSKTPELESKVIADLEGRLARLTAQRDGQHADAWGAKGAALRLAQYYRRKSRTADLRRALTTYGAAFVRLAESASAIQGAAWLRDVHDCYREFGLVGEANELLVKVREFAKRSQAEMAAHRQRIEIPHEEMERFLDQMVGDDLSTSLHRLAVQFLPDKDAVIGQIEGARKSAPLMSLVPITVVDAEGRPTSTIGSVDDDLDGRIARHISQDMQFSGVFLFAAINRVREKFAPNAQSLLDHLGESPALGVSQFAVLHAGMKAYLEGDHLAAAHLLVPQIEAAIRHLVDILGGTLWKPHRGGGLMQKNLEDLLREELVEMCLTPNVVLYLRILLTDQRGWNLRNDICHGLTLATSFGRSMTDRLLHAFLVLGLLRKSGGVKPQA